MSEFSEHDGGGDGDVEALGRRDTLGERGYAERVGDERTHLWRQAVALVAHDDDAATVARLPGVGAVDVSAVEECAIDGQAVLTQADQGLGEVNITESYACEGAHRGLDNLGVVAVSGVAAAEDMADAEPVGGAYDGPEVAGVLHSVEGEQERFPADKAEGGEIRGGVGNTEECDSALRRAQRGHLLYLLGCGVVGCDEEDEFESGA